MAHQANGHNYQFYGVGHKKAVRRTNGGRPRKMYPYATKEQKGGPMERFIHNNYDGLDEQYNSKNRGPGKMYAEDASGKLGSHWGNIKRRMTSGSAVARHVREKGGSVGQARTALVGMSGVSFGADPKSR